MGKILAGVLALSVCFASAAYALDRRIRVHNYTSSAVVGLYGPPIDAPRWDYNMIDSYSKTIRSGETKMADIDDGTGYCRYDLRAVLADGRTLERYDLNVCEYTDWKLYD